MLLTHMTSGYAEVADETSDQAEAAVKVAALDTTAERAELDETLSVIMRFHKQERLPLLQEALFSLAIQSWRNHEIIIMVQNGTDEIKKAIMKIVERQPWPKHSRHKINLVHVADGVDGRSTLLNRGIEQATGRYLAFLDDDDLIYHHGYVTLIQQLKEGGCAVALGGCRMARAQYLSDHWYIRTKETPFAWGRTRMDLFRDNFVPIHSYVIDRARINPADLYFDDELPPLEDYDFLLRLCAKYDFDFSKLDTPVCEYRIHGLNSLPYDINAPPECHTSHSRAQKLIAERKKDLICSLPVSEVAAWQEQIAGLQGRVAALQQQIVKHDQDTLHEQGRFLNTATRKIYTFFGRFPHLETRISGSVHSSWQLYKRITQRGTRAD